MSRRVNVLIVDDSAVVRQYMKTLLEKQGDMQAVSAADPIIAMRKMVSFRPDVIVLDIEMPRMDGLTFLRKIMAEDPIPVVICSGVAQRGTKAALDALSQGAVEIITKPQFGLREFLKDSAVMLVDAVLAAAQADVRKRRPPAADRLTADAVLPVPLPSRAAPQTEAVVAIGASTGGPEALEVILSSLPKNSPGVVIVQHMPKNFTQAFAERLDGICEIQVKEAQSGDAVGPGRALIAPGNQHMTLLRGIRGYTVDLLDGPLVSRHRPSVDVLFRSVAEAAGSNALGVILTGMGDDGVQGMLEMKRNGAATVAQDKASSVVFGMPKEAIHRRAADKVLALKHVAAFILRKAYESAGSVTNGKTSSSGT